MKHYLFNFWIINFLKYVTKLKHTEQESIQNDIQKIFNINDVDLDKVLKDLRTRPDETVKSGLGSFIVLGHLVERQYLIISTQNLGQKNSLVFKFPAHQKKLQQFINSRINKKVNTKAFPMSFFALLFIISQNLDEHILLTKKALKKKQVPEILKDLEKLLSKYEYPHNYPQQYI